MALPRSLAGHVYQAVSLAESRLASLRLLWGQEPAGLNVFMFHRLSTDAAVYDRNEIMPHQYTSVSHFEECIACMLDAGYTFLRPQDLPARRHQPGRYVILTFDDGYLDVLRTIPILERHDVPAVFFISTRFVREQKAFWTDVIYREVMRQPQGLEKLKPWLEEFSRLTTEQIEQRLLAAFGPDCLKPLGDIDRTLTATELEKFAQHPLVVIGNHTANHAVLPLFSEEQVMAEISLGQEHLREMTGRLPEAIAYPGGQFNRRIIELARTAGLKFGFTGFPDRWSAQDLASRDLLAIPRMALRGDRSIRRQCVQARANLQLYRKLRPGHSSPEGGY